MTPGVPSGAVCRISLVDERGSTRLGPRSIARIAGALDEHSARVIVLEGRAGSFCEGLDLERLAGGDEEKSAERFDLARFADLIQCLATMDVPVIALVDGPALGGGLGIAAAADLVLATGRATFGLPETVFGLIPGIVFPIVARRMGMARARLLALGQPALTAREALEAGLVDQIVNDGQAALGEQLKRLGRLDPEAVRQFKNLVAAFFPPPAEYVSAAVRAFDQLTRTPATQSRLQRFASGDVPWPTDD